MFQAQDQFGWGQPGHPGTPGTHCLSYQTKLMTPLLLLPHVLPCLRSARSPSLLDILDTQPTTLKSVHRFFTICSQPQQLPQPPIYTVDSTGAPHLQVVTVPQVGLVEVPRHEAVEQVVARLVVASSVRSPHHSAWSRSRRAGVGAEEQEKEREKEQEKNQESRNRSRNRSRGRRAGMGSAGAGAKQEENRSRKTGAGEHESK